MAVPADRKYVSTHEWAKLGSDGLVAVGITDHAQEQLGDLVFVELPQLGKALAKGEECAVVESVKAASDIYAPVAGEVVEVNGELANSPEKINEDANGAWIFRLRPSNAGELDTLLDASGYEALIAEGEH
jgi:glycine cleavage system H protein